MLKLCIIYPRNHAVVSAPVGDKVVNGLLLLGWKLLSCCQSQELGQLASDWLFTLVQPIRSQLANLASDLLFTLVQPIRSQLAR